MTFVNDSISVDDGYKKVKKFTKFQNNADIFDKYMASSNFDVMFDNLRRHNSVNRDAKKFK